MKLALDQLSCGYRNRAVVHDVSLQVETGEVLCLLGANGSGKTTLFKTLLRLLPPVSGRILVDGEDLAAWPHRRLAHVLAYVPQLHTPPFAFQVRDVVLMARAAYLNSFASPGPEDMRIAEEALEQLGIAQMAEALYTEISGGERQLVLIARALAQQPRFLILDEPTSSLDFANQHLVLRKVRELSGSGLGVVMTTHDPDHAFTCASQVALLKGGRMEACGRPADVLTTASLSSAYGCSLRIVEAEENLRMVIPHSCA